ncbi:DUF5788 family protein [Halorhabdus amylolytica]|uniref:DUF5788 family protein n=1 Tax=Halorhabdus amylolytica TaxID=2559573 RepID=UPI0010AAD63B|nr:DUF5788 family protein [Halorhabdus amylolytica]
MNEYERKQLLERVEREGATVGAEIPDAIEIDGESLDLRTFVFETRRREAVPAEERDRVESVKTKLRRERTRRVERLESASLSYEEGEALAESIVGIDRALHALENLEPADVEAEREAATTADRRRWMRFLRKALGQDGDAGDRRARGGP